MNTIDIKGGQMSFGQRIELGKIITDPELTDYDRFKQCILCIDPNWKVIDMFVAAKYYQEILEGIKYWIEREKRELKYNPTPEELSAGIEVFSMSVGEMSTIMALAKDFAQDPDEILKWKYGKVFNILFTNLQSHLFRERLNRRIAEKAKAEASKGHRGKR